MEGCRRRDRRAQKALYEMMAPMAMGVCMRYARSREDAQDVMQDGFVRVFERIGQLRDASSLGAWVNRVMVNESMRHSRHRWYQHHQLVENIEEVESLRMAEETYDMESIVLALQHLTASQRAVFNLIEVDGYSFKEASEMMHCTESNLRALLSRAKMNMREELSAENEK